MALQGITVLDLTRLLPGPLCGRHLGDLGARVIKVEDPAHPDMARFMPPYQGNDTWLHNQLNRNKESLTLRLQTEAGRAAFLRLVAQADVLLENYRPGGADKLGIGYAALREVNPRLVYCAITGYGQTGPWADEPGHDLNFLARSGILHQTGNAHGPALSNLQIADLMGGTQTATIAILAALLQRHQSGEGAFLDVSMLEGTLAHAEVMLSTLNAEGQSRPMSGDALSGGFHAYNIYPTADDKFIALGTLEPKFWQRFCTVAEKPEWLDKHLLGGAAAEEMRETLTAYFRTDTRDAWAAKFEGEMCCITPVLSLAEALATPHLQHRQPLLQVPTAAHGPTPQFAFPVRLPGNRPTETATAAPALGAHSAAILAELGFTSTEIATLQA
jgi:crotonobetainyl-CoA:carnitine CoA-transferase CaiB-like acyl-CoA transferase